MLKDKILGQKKRMLCCRAQLYCYGVVPCGYTVKLEKVFAWILKTF